MAPDAFPASFLFGTATSATQIEGHCFTSDWSAFAAQPGRIKNGDRPDIACDSWHRWRTDLALQKSLGMGAYRFGVEWARIEPRPGAIDHGALDEYRRMLGCLRDSAIESMVTLHHFTLPAWLAEVGGVLAPSFPDRFARFARVVAHALGDLNRLWITINEPNVLAAHAYLLGVWPPARKSPGLAWRAQGRMLVAHHAAYRALKEGRPDALVGIAHHLRVVEPERFARTPEGIGHRTIAARADFYAAKAFRSLFNDPFARAACRARTQDFFGINYYSRDIVRFSARHPGELFLHRGVRDGADTNDLGWEIYPEGLGLVVREWAKVSGLPIYITENGLADAKDEKRARFITSHLRELARAIDDGVDVRGYFHWSLLDNFEWADGYGPRFGLAAVNYATQERSLRPSAHAYARIAKERRIERARAPRAQS
jgi:beta-glucosidase